MHNDICTQVEWILQEWRCKSIVYHHRQLFLFCDGGECSYVNDLHHRVRWRFDPKHFCFFIDLFSYCIFIMHINEMKIDSKMREHLCEHSVRTAIQIVSCNY